MENADAIPRTVDPRHGGGRIVAAGTASASAAKPRRNGKRAAE